MDNLTSRITSNPAICGGDPCIKGTRIPVYIVLGLLAAGETVEGVLRAYPHIHEEDIRACIRHAALLSREEVVVRA